MNSDDPVELLRSQCLSLFAPTILDVPAAIIERYEEILVPVFGEKGFFIARLDPRPVTTMRELFDSVAAACGFPERFGRTWHSLKDYLLNFSWMEPKPSGFLLLYRHPEHLNWTDLSEFIILADRVRIIYAEHGKPFKVLMAGRSFFSTLGRCSR
jgi:hypothetical protein